MAAARERRQGWDRKNMDDIQTLLKSEAVKAVLKPIVEKLKWGEINIIVRDGKIVMSEIKQAVKHS